MREKRNKMFYDIVELSLVTTIVCQVGLPCTISGYGARLAVSSRQRPLGILI